MILASVRSRVKGFTLIEMLVTVTIVGVLATVAFPVVGLTQRRSQERELREALRSIRTAIDQYKQAVDEGRIVEDVKGSGYPPSLNFLVSGVTDVKSAGGAKKIFFLRRLPLDPLQPVLGSGNESNWGLRSYASPADNPQPGPDVYDVYSLSPGTGLNGKAYRTW